MDARTFVAAVLAPHHAEDAELGEVRLALQNVDNLLIFAFRQPVLDKDFISDHKYPWISAAVRRQSLATAEGRGFFVTTRTSRGSGERIVRRYRGSSSANNEIHGLQPWLSSVAAPRLKTSLSCRIPSFGDQCVDHGFKN